MTKEAFNSASSLSELLHITLNHSDNVCKVFFLREYYKGKDGIVNKRDSFLECCNMGQTTLKDNFNLTTQIPVEVL